MLFAITVLACLLLGTAGALHFIYARRRRTSLLETRLSDQQRTILAERAPLVRRLPPALRNRLEGLIAVFLDQVSFQGYDGLEVTEEMRLVIAAQACLLVSGQKNRWYRDLRTILIYPGAFTSIQTEHNGLVERQTNKVRIGESWDRGPVILSWAHAAEGAFIDNDGHNVVLHEFAHQLDTATGVTDGAPLLARNHDAARWAKVFQEAYARLVDNIQNGRDTVLDPYGTTAPAEFFAVAVEAFFEQPDTLRRSEPALYAQMAEYFGFDPAAWR